jgi:hypothetical protein
MVAERRVLRVKREELLRRLEPFLSARPLPERAKEP